MKLTPLERRLTALYEPVVTGSGLRLVAVKVLGTEIQQTVQVMAENPQTRRLGVDDCALLSRELSALMDVEDPITAPYRLEISSPGIDRLLMTMQDFADYIGHEAKVELGSPAIGQKKFRGRIGSVDENEGVVIIATEDKGEFVLPFVAIDKAKLVLTDALIKATAVKSETPTEEKTEA